MEELSKESAASTSDALDLMNRMLSGICTVARRRPHLTQRLLYRIADAVNPFHFRLVIFIDEQIALVITNR